MTAKEAEHGAHWPSARARRRWVNKIRQQAKRTGVDEDQLIAEAIEQRRERQAAANKRWRAPVVRPASRRKQVRDEGPLVIFDTDE